MLDTLPDWQKLDRLQKSQLVAPLAQQGMSARVIAGYFSNVTRNSIISHCSRYDIRLGRVTPAKSKKTRQPDQPHGNKGQPKANAIRARRDSKFRLRSNQSNPYGKQRQSEAEKGRKAADTYAVKLLAQTPPTAPGSNPKPLVDLAPGECKFSVSSHGEIPSGKTLFCGAPGCAGSYCDFHHAIAYRDPTANEHKDIEYARKLAKQTRLPA